MRVRDLAQMSDLGLSVLAGQEHLDREIRWVHITDLPDPEPYLRGGELILTNGLWRGVPADTDPFVARLARCEVAALGLAVYRPAGTPADLISACQRHGVVLLEVPDRPFMDISEAVINQIVRERDSTAQHVARVEQSAVWRLGRGEGPQGILRALHHAQGVDCWLLDRTARVIGGVGEAPAPGEIADVWRQSMARGAVDEHAAQLTRLTVVRLRATPDRPDQVDGILVYAKARPEAVERADLDLAGDLLGQELAHRASVRQSQRQYAGELVSLAAQDALSASETSARLQALHLDPERDVLVVAVAPRRPGADVSAALADGVEAMLRLRGLSSVIVAVSGETVRGIATLPPGGDDSVVDHGSLGPLTMLAGTAVAVGVADGPGRELRRLVTEASHAASVAAVAADSPSLTRSRETGSHLLLLALHKEEIRRAFVASVLDPVIAYDTERSGQLLHSLATFLDCGCSWQATAARLQVHVNTVRYRIHRVEQVTGRDLESMSDRVDLYLALEARRVAT